MIKKLTISVFLLTVFTFFISCKKSEGDSGTSTNDDTNQVDEEGINQEVATERLNSVEEETPPRAEKIEEEIVFEDTVYTDPETMYETADESNLSKIELLINGSSSASSARFFQEESAFTWLLESTNGEQVSEKEKYLLIFHLDGKYKKFNVATKEAEWGYFYVNEDFTMLAFDYKDKRFAEKYAIADISEKGLYLHNRAIKLAFKPYLMKGMPSNRFTPTRTPEPEKKNLLTLTNEGQNEGLNFIASAEADEIPLTSFAVNTKSKERLTPVSIDILKLEGFRESNVEPANPVKLTGADTKGFKISGTIKSPEEPGTYYFYFVLTDEKGNQEVDSLGYKVDAPKR